MQSSTWPAWKLRQQHTTPARTEAPEPRGQPATSRMPRPRRQSCRSARKGELLPLVEMSFLEGLKATTARMHLSKGVAG